MAYQALLHKYYNNTRPKLITASASWCRFRMPLHAACLRLPDHLPQICRRLSTVAFHCKCPRDMQTILGLGSEAGFPERIWRLSWIENLEAFPRKGRDGKALGNHAPEIRCKRKCFEIQRNVRSAYIPTMSQLCPNHVPTHISQLCPNYENTEVSCSIN